MSLIARIRLLAIFAILAGMLTLVSIALHASVMLVISLAAIGTTAGAGILLLVQKLRCGVDQANTAIASYIRGTLDARILDIGRLDEIGRLQHRLNNLFDIVDLHARGKQSAVETGDDEAYLEKLYESGLYEALEESGESNDSEAKPVSAGGFLKELRDSVHDLLKGEGTDDVSQQSEKMRSLMQQSRMIGQQLQRGLNLLDQARDQWRQSSLGLAQEQQRPQASSIRSLERQLRQLAEQIGLLSLNAAIEAGRVGDVGQGFAAVAGEVKMLGNKIDRIANDISQETAAFEAAWSIAPPSSPQMRIPESFEMAFLTLRDQIDALTRFSNALEELSGSSTTGLNEAA